MKYQFTIEVTADMIHVLHLKNSHLLVYAFLDWYTRNFGCYELGIDEMARMLDLDRSTTYNAVRSLVMNGLIEVNNYLDSQGKKYKRIHTIERR